MKYVMTAAVLAAWLAGLVGCSKPASFADVSKVNNLGVLVADGKPSQHVLADGRTCVVTPTPLDDGKVSLKITVVETNAGTVKRSSLVAETLVTGQACLYSFDTNTPITLTLQAEK